jgi:membrane associated rhomboid family serine protease
VLALVLLFPLLLLVLAGFLPENLGGVSMCAGFGGLVVGLVLALHVLRQALAADDA